MPVVERPAAPAWRNITIGGYGSRIAFAALTCPGRREGIAPRLLLSSPRTRGPITTDACCRQNCGPRLAQHNHWWLWVPDRVRCAHLSGTTRGNSASHTFVLPAH